MLQVCLWDLNDKFEAEWAGNSDLYHWDYKILYIEPMNKIPKSWANNWGHQKKSQTWANNWGHG
jgi:hypothetical protein